MDLKGSTEITVSKDFVYCNVKMKWFFRNGRWYILWIKSSGCFHLGADKRNSKTIDEVRDAILDEYDVGKDECEKDLMELLQELTQKGMIVVKD